MPQHSTVHQAKANAWPWPRPAASAAIFRGGSVLLAERASGPKKGSWSLPGGKVKLGETAAAAALREVREETGLDIRLEGLVDLHDVIVRDDSGTVTLHYCLSVFYGIWLSGEPVAATDISDARFVPIPDIGTYPLTDGATRFIHEAAQRLGLA
ncbi:MAG: NUDIX hydrolase [Hyphomicrobiaceae bacterium]